MTKDGQSHQLKYKFYYSSIFDVFMYEIGESKYKSFHLYRSKKIIGSKMSEDKSNKPKQQHTLQGTTYGKLELDVQRIINKQKKRSRDEAPSKSTKNDTANHDNKDDNDKDEENSGSRKKANLGEKKSAAVVRNTAALEYTGPIKNFINERTVYVQGFPFTCEEDGIKTFFEAAGSIKSVRLPRWHDSGKLKGYGHIEFNTKSGADKALEMTGQYIQDRYITVDRPMVPRALSGIAPASVQTDKTAKEGSDEEGEANDATTAPASATPAKLEKPPGCRTIFIKNLPYDVTEEDVRKHFMVYGPIVSVRLAMWNHTQNQKGFGYIDFKREDSADIAVRKSGSIVMNERIVVVDFETKAPKKGYKNTSSNSNNKNKSSFSSHKKH